MPPRGAQGPERSQRLGPRLVLERCACAAVPDAGPLPSPPLPLTPLRSQGGRADLQRHGLLGRVPHGAEPRALHGHPGAVPRRLHPPGGRPGLPGAAPAPALGRLQVRWGGGEVTVTLPVSIRST